jgi:ribosomal protein S18 acetylase RimI-like enzyme
MIDPDSQLEIVRAPAERQADAMGALLAAGPSAARRFIDQAVRASIRLDYLWCLADRDGRYRMAVLSVPSLGRTAMLIASRARTSKDVPELARLIRAAADGSESESDLAQGLLDPTHSLDILAYEMAGLERMALLEYLERALPRAGTLARPEIPAGWSIEAAAPRTILSGDDASRLPAEARATLTAVLESTYVDTLDCPGLAGLRATSDVLDGHFGVGARRRHWLILRRNGAACGVCLLNDSPDGTSSELAYFGLAPAVRGLGLARILLAAALHEVSAARVGAITLAVDARNAPAKRLYASNGFRQTTSRVALVRAARRAR